MKACRDNCLMLSICAILLAAPAAAELTDQGPAGFTSRSVYEISAPPADVWTALCDEIAEWWNPAHTWSGDAANLSLVGAAGEELSESLPDGGGVVHLEVINASPGKLLRMKGCLGPLQGMALVGVLTVEMTAAADKTLLTATYTVGGYTADGLTGLAGPVDGVIAEQFRRLQAYVER